MAFSFAFIYSRDNKVRDSIKYLRQHLFIYLYQRPIKSTFTEDARKLMMHLSDDILLGFCVYENTSDSIVSN